ncbi:hypothetical protein [Nonomuraea sp. SBT364]|uniref:hypothetical protein n=1 Tax=Nonomuraea sp. SBT364 TaxID=1580530 RepID=UPI00066EE711|nr:hypothetical protein [Nonomuraea sp. SBT364]
MTNPPALPTWETMTDLDKGCALLHLAKVESDGSAYARQHYPARYLSHPVLKALDKAAACDHAASLFADGIDGAYERLGGDEADRLYDLALDADRGMSR